jgi:ribokinase
MMRPLLVDPARLRYQALIGAGGIGTGSFFALNGDHTLGREESRSGRFLDRHDYCKLHIIAHYVLVLLQPHIKALPIGRVGDDGPGQAVLTEMAETGFDLRYVQIEPRSQTLNSICFVYPDGSGGNLTVDDSASSHVDAAQVRAAEGDMVVFGSRGIALVAPEVPLEARAEMLALATKHGLYRSASFTSEEMRPACQTGLLAKVDLLAMNRDEAAALSGRSANSPPDELAHAALEVLRRVQPAMLVSVTAGAEGSYLWDGLTLGFRPSHAVPVASTAGAGDAHLGGMLTGLAAGLTPAEAHELATLVAGLSVTSPHTINKDVDRASLGKLAGELPALPSRRVCALLGRSF